MLNAAGLFANMVGVLIAFKYGFPQPSFEEAAPLSAEDNTRMPNGRTVREHGADARKLKLLYSSRSRFALTLMGAGFLLQFLALLADKV
jgi:hypothetical protein